ncbi:DUF6122 family protein [Psychroserpens sp. Hel_I_66]|uniref:DUF6122 family protein n=1 Tax=Psychroserpens sp. Hel_I_66 TaxID=1250004 RepID=UPI000646C05E|nr:DUF6122 family protein [Psychroserpens sp. Hel_I_66]
MLRTSIHYGIHFLVPVIVALLFFRKNWKMASLIMLSAIAIDLDHLLANPIFDPTRCSINFHPLHSYYAIGIYVLLTIIKKTRVIGLGLLIHILADLVDCAMI